jgi:hypothetical protein
MGTALEWSLVESGRGGFLQDSGLGRAYLGDAWTTLKGMADEQPSLLPPRASE